MQFWPQFATIYTFPDRINPRKGGDNMTQSLDKIADNFANTMVSNLNYNVLIEALAIGEKLDASEVISLFQLSKERNSNLEEDIKNYKPTP